MSGTIDNEHRTCPWCGSDVVVDLGCHTWPRKVTREDGSTFEQFMSCMPCDSATVWSCETFWMIEGDEELQGRTPCNWSWTDGLNPRNPRAEENDERNPHWEDG